jgi:hypothetical protein
MKLRRFYLIACLLLLGSWVGYWLAGGWLARFVAACAGGALLRLGQGKFNDPVLFVHHRLHEALWLVSGLLVWVAIQGLFHRMIARDGREQRRPWTPWLTHSLVGFVLLNGWIACASHTALFWAVMGAGSGVENYMQFNFKRTLLEELHAPRKAVLVGSSQTRSQIDENLLNSRLGTNLWTTELHFPGSKAYDLLLIEPQLRQADPDLVICYFSENYLYAGSVGETVPNFFGFSKLPDAWERGALKYIGGEGIAYGLLGDALPLFRCREIMSRRVLGFAVMNLKQSNYDASLVEDLTQRARAMAPGYRLNAESDFQKRAMEDFVRRCQAAGRTVILIDGGFNPILMQAIDPAVRQDQAEFLAHLERDFANVIVVPSEALAVQTAADFEDLNHVNPDMQRRFTEALAGWLEGHLAGRTPDASRSP